MLHNPVCDKGGFRWLVNTEEVIATGEVVHAIREDAVAIKLLAEIKMVDAGNVIDRTGDGASGGYRAHGYGQHGGMEARQARGNNTDRLSFVDTFVTFSAITVAALLPSLISATSNPPVLPPSYNKT